MSFLEINEEWIKDRVKITNQKLDDIKSLSLPGTYDEKIFKLGPSLIHFTRIKELDLSRNVLESLEGIDHLRCLESLNLYYNNIASLKELYRLRSNASLAQLDLRLNPVARNEADYRLCLIHMLPLLIRLDDRCVKDQERKAALMYFGSDQSREFSVEHASHRDETNRSGLTHPVKKTHPRVEMVNRWTKGIVKEDLFTSAPNESENFHLNINDLDPEDTENINAPRLKEKKSVQEYSPRDSNYLGNKRLSVEREYFNDKSQSFRQSKQKTNYSTVPVFIRQDEVQPINDNHNKGHGDSVNMFTVDDKNGPRYDAFVSNMASNSKMHSLHHTYDDDREGNLPREMTDKICDYVDRYWNGSRSLHQNHTFIASISQIINSFSSKQSEDSESKDEINFLRENLCKLERENRHFKEQLSVPKSCHKDPDREDIYDIKRTNQFLKDEIGELRRKLEASEKVSEITDLLKQSHDSLIDTNEQLRRQLSQQNKSFKSRGY